MSLVAVRCEACGGAVAFAAGAPEPRCLFCGTAALVPAELPEEVEPPEGLLPFTVDAKAADAAFRKFAASSIWYPGDLRRARLKLKPLFLPAWSWSGRVETHWTALVRDTSTRSDKRPRAGSANFGARGVLVPASQALSRRELDAIGPFAGGELRPLAEADAPVEVGQLTRTAARRAGEEGMAALHAAELRAQIGALALRTVHVFTDVEGGPLLLPVWIGAYRRGDRVFRVVVNGQTAKLTGKAPVSWLRIGCAAILAVAVLAGLAAAVATVLALAQLSNGR